MTNPGSRIEVHVTKDPLVTIEAGGVGLKIGIVVDDTDVTPAVARDISGALAKAIEVTDPDGVVTSKTAAFADFGSFAGDGTDGAIMFTTASASEIATPGIWKLQAKITNAGGVIFSSEKIYFIVRA